MGTGYSALIHRIARAIQVVLADDEETVIFGGFQRPSHPMAIATNLDVVFLGDDEVITAVARLRIT